MTLEPVYLKLSEKYTTGWVQADQDSHITIEVDISKYAIVGEIDLKEEEDKRKNFMTLIKNCKHEKLKMFPDYSSSGLWCATVGCGCNVYPQEVPLELMNLIEGWVLLWDILVRHPDEYNLESVKILFNRNGRTLCKMVNQYIPCEYVEDELIG